MTAQHRLQHVQSYLTTPQVQGYDPRDHEKDQSLGMRPLYRTPLHWYAISDVVALTVGFLLACALSYGLSGILGAETLSSFGEILTSRVLLFSAMAVGLILWFQYTKHYRIRMPFWQEVQQIVYAVAFTMMADGFLQFAANMEVSRLLLLSTWAFAGVAMVIGRSLIRIELKKHHRFAVPSLLVGSGETAARAMDALSSERNLGFVVAAQIDNLNEAFLAAGGSWERLCRQHGASHVVIALDGEKLKAAERPLAQLMRESVSFSISTMMKQLPVQGVVPQYMLNHDIMFLTRARGLEEFLPRVIKRTTDILASASALLLLSPLLLLLGLLVKRDGGPAFYGHPRIGMNGKSFKCLKFRSMAVNGDAILEAHLAENPQARVEWEETRKLLNDPRVTKIGAFLRKSSLDELPQLINVLKGEMSLVGPRPIVTAEVEKYHYDIQYYYSVRPGITGLWQVSGRSDISYEQRVEMDGWYVRNWTLWHDIVILCKTFPALMNRSGAY